MRLMGLMLWKLQQKTKRNLLSFMNPGYWNEYVGTKSGFFAKMPNGKIWHYTLTEENEEKMNHEMNNLVTSWNLDIDLSNWVANVDIYRGSLKIQ